MSTVQSTLNAGEPNSFPDAIRRLNFGDLLAGLVPRRLVRTGLTSSATHVEPEAGLISIVAIADDAALTKIEAGTAGAGEVLVAYDSEGVATLTFGDGANTGYRVVKTVLPTALVANLALDNGTGF